MSAYSNPKIDALRDISRGTFVYRRIFEGSLRKNLVTKEYEIKSHTPPSAIDPQSGSVSVHQKHIIDAMVNTYAEAFTPPLKLNSAIYFEITKPMIMTYRVKGDPIIGRSGAADLAHAAFFSKTEKRILESELAQLVFLINQAGITIC